MSSGLLGHSVNQVVARFIVAFTVSAESPRLNTPVLPPGLPSGLALSLRLEGMSQSERSRLRLPVV